MVRQWLKGERTVSASAAFQVGQILNQYGETLNCGPIAQYAAGHYSAVIKFLDRLANQESGSTKWDALPGAYMAVCLYCSLWAHEPEAVRKQLPTFGPGETKAVSRLIDRAHELLRSICDSVRSHSEVREQFTDANNPKKEAPPLTDDLRRAHRFAREVYTLPILRARPDAVTGAWMMLSEWAALVHPIYTQFRGFLSVPIQIEAFKFTESLLRKEPRP